MSNAQRPLPPQYAALAIPTSIDYTSKDFTSFVSGMLTYAAQAAPDWNPGSEGDFGLVMVELMAYVGDILSYYGDRLSQEAYLPTATQRLSVLNIAQLLGYVPYGALPAGGTVTFTTFAGGPSVTVPGGTQVSTNVVPDQLTEPPVFETTADVTVPGNAGTASVTVTQGIRYTKIQLGTSDGTPGQAFAVPQLQVQNNSVQVFVDGVNPDAPDAWNQVDFLIDAGPEDEDFAISTDQSGVTWVTFGDNTNGVIPGTGLNVWASYQVIAGAAGNLPAGAVNTISSPVGGVDIALLPDNVTPDSTAMTGGSDPESTESIRTHAAQAFRAQYRAVSLQDYNDLAMNVPGVMMVNAISQHSTSVALYVAGANYLAPNTALVNAILDYFDGKQADGVSLSVVPPSIIAIDVGVAANPMQLVVRDGFSQVAVTTNVKTALQSLLSPPNVIFGQLLNVSDLYEVALAVDGVAYCVIPAFSREDVPQANDASIQLRPTEFATPGQIFMTVTGGFTS